MNKVYDPNIELNNLDLLNNITSQSSTSSINKQQCCCENPLLKEPVDDMQRQTILQNLYADSKEAHTASKKVTASQMNSQAYRVIYPNTLWYLFWKMLISFLIVWYFFEIPVYIAFTKEIWDIIPQWGVGIALGISFILFCIDIVLEFNTAYYKHGNLVVDKSEIAQQYFKSYMIYDITAYLAFYIRAVLDIDSFRWVYLLFYLKYFSLGKIDLQFEEAILLQRRGRTVYNFFKVILWLQYAFVVYGCVWYMIGNAALNDGLNSWLSNDGNWGVIGDMQPWSKFFFSYYFSLGTMTTTMGFGDIQPLNMYEATCGLCGIMFAVIIFAIMVNSLFKIIEEYNLYPLKIYKQRVAINRFMKTKDVPPVLRERVRQYLNEHWYEEGNRDLQMELEIFKDLAPELRSDLMLNSYGKFLQTLPLFYQNFTKAFIKELSMKVVEVNYGQGEIIFINDEQFVDDFGIYYISQGNVLIYPNMPDDNDSKLQLNSLMTGQYFGEWSFLTGQARKASAVAYTYASLYKVSRDDLLAVLKQFPMDFERYWMIRDMIVYSKQLGIIGQCWTCGSTSHYCNECDITHYIPNVHDVLMMSNIHSVQVRRKRRRNIYKWRTLCQLNKIQSYHEIQERTSGVCIANDYNNIIRNDMSEVDKPFQFQQYFIDQNYSKQGVFDNVSTSKLMNRRNTMIVNKPQEIRQWTISVNNKQ